MKKIRIGISSCLIGEKVRYDGGHKLDVYIMENLGKYAELVPVCPEVECGMPAPREAMRLTGDPGRSPPGDDKYKIGFYGKIIGMGEKEGFGTGEGKPVRLCIQEPLAQLRGQGSGSIRRGRRIRKNRDGHLRKDIDGQLSSAAGRGRRKPSRPRGHEKISTIIRKSKIVA